MYSAVEYYLNEQEVYTLNITQDSEITLGNAGNKVVFSHSFCKIAFTEMQ
jgi:hypothetical protein